jgi:hypothetical protein
MRFSTLFNSPQGCTCYDNKNSQCAPNYWCNECRNNPSNPNCNMRVGNRVVPRYQTQSGNGQIYATPTNRFRNAMPLMPMGINTGGFGMPMGNSGRDAYQNAVGMGNPTMVAPAFGGTKTPSTLGLNACKRCYRRGCDCVRDEKGRYGCGCDVVNPEETRLKKWWQKNFGD